MRCQLPLRELDARVADLLSEGARDGLSNARRGVEARRLLRLAQLGSGADDAQQQRRREDFVEVLVDVGAKPGIPGFVSPWHAEKIEARAIRIEQPRPNDEHSALALDDPVIVRTHEPGPTRDEQIAPRYTIEDVVTYLRNDRAR